MARQKLNPHLLLGITLTLAQITTPKLYGQNPTAPTQQNAPANSQAAEFEVATIKPGAVGPDGVRQLSLNIYPGGRIRITNWTLKDMVHAAYGLSYWQLQGGPAWIEKDLYDVEAKPPDPTEGADQYITRRDNWSFEDPKLQVMLQRLLEDRFQLKTHLAVKDGPVHILETSGTALALTPAKHHGIPAYIGSPGGSGKLTNATMAQFAAYLSNYVLHETVIDKTGLEGTYDFQSKTASTNDEGPFPDPLAILPSVKEMGLKLTKSTGPVTILIIDQASHPSAN